MRLGPFSLLSEVKKIFLGLTHWLHGLPSTTNLLLSRMQVDVAIQRMNLVAGDEQLFPNP
jgi:hypothetical protein